MRHNEYTEIADNFCKKHNVTVKFTYKKGENYENHNHH